MTILSLPHEFPVFKSEIGRRTFIQAYDRLMECWPTEFVTLDINTDYGPCHTIVSGPEDGEPILMLHGMTANSAMWYPTIEALSGYRIYCVDAPGDFGKSKVVKRIRTVDDAVQWIDQLLAGLKLSKATFIGHSMGGWFCSSYAVMRPERVRRLVLLAPVATFLPVPFWKLFTTVYPALLFPKPDRIRRAWKWFCAKGYSLPPAVMDVLTAAYTHGRPQLPVIPRVIEKELWKNLVAPVMFLVGDEERIYNVNRVKQRVRESLPSATICTIQGASHCLMLEQKKAVNEAIRDFLIG